MGRKGVPDALVCWLLPALGGQSRGKPSDGSNCDLPTSPLESKPLTQQCPQTGPERGFSLPQIKKVAGTTVASDPSPLTLVLWQVANPPSSPDSVSWWEAHEISLHCPVNRGRVGSQFPQSKDQGRVQRAVIHSADLALVERRTQEGLCTNPTRSLSGMGARQAKAIYLPA